MLRVRAVERSIQTGKRHIHVDPHTLPIRPCGDRECVVDEDVEATVVGGYGSERCGDVSVVAVVAFYSVPLATQAVDLVHYILERPSNVLVRGHTAARPARYDDGRTLLGKAQGDTLADAARCAGYERNAAKEWFGSYRPRCYQGDEGAENTVDHSVF